MPCSLVPLSNDGSGKLRFQIMDTEERPAFARVLLPGGSWSAPAIVTLIDRLRAAIRESYSRRTESARRQLDGETDATLALLDVFDVLEKIESPDDQAKDPLSIPKAAEGGDEQSDPTRYKTLSYEEFITGRRPRTAGAPAAHNSLAGSEVSIVRGFLNRILGLKAEDIEDQDDEDAALKSAFDLGDETASPEADLAAGREFEKEKTPTDTELAENERRQKAAQRKATKGQIIAAVMRFHERIKERQEMGALTNNDILRLRALLMIVCTAAWRGQNNTRGDATPPSSLEVLPAEGDNDSWPVVIGRLLFIFFGGNTPAIRDFYLSAEHDQVPGDIAECWATCYWCMQACLTARLSSSEHERISRYLTPLAEKTYRLTLPTKDELLGDDVMTIIDGMNGRFARKLSIDPAAITNGHRASVQRLFSPPD